MKGQTDEGKPDLFYYGGPHNVFFTETSLRASDSNLAAFLHLTLNYDQKASRRLRSYFRLSQSTSTKNNIPKFVCKI